MSTQHDEQAFPVLDYTFEANDCTYKHESKGGMSLRDYFAAKALPAVLDQKDVQVGSELNNAALISYKLADAMLAARSK